MRGRGERSGEGGRKGVRWGDGILILGWIGISVASLG